ncbi:MAG: hypothetical protein H0T52_02020 [Lautropia sp.]|nr:hypothetical protein [Lautropia sp.]
MSIAPGAMSAVRRLAPLAGDLSGWLVEPVHFHLAKDHLVLLAGAAHDLDTADAGQLSASILPLLEEASFKLSILTPRVWLLSPQAPSPQAPSPQAPPEPPEPSLQLDCASSDAAAGRNVEGYLPEGSDARRYRKLLNEIQMTWHEHPVNQRREREGRLAINSIWLSGPAEAPALAAWKRAVSEGRYEVDESLLAARLVDDRFAWLDAMQALDARMQAWLAAADPPAILLCGDTAVRWLQRSQTGRRAAARRAVGDAMNAFARRLRTLVPGQSGEGRGRTGGRAAAVDPLVQMFSEAP